MTTQRLVKLDRAFTFAKAITEQGEFEGYASTFGNEDSYGDVIRKGAFKVGLQKLAKAGRNVKMLWNHDKMQPIGVFKDADEDSKGLWVRGKITAGVQRGDETRLLMLDKAIDSMSIGGYVVKEIFDNKTFKSELLEIELREISPVTFEANDQALIATVKSIEGIGSISELEAILRDAGGFSREQAKLLIAKAKRLDTPREAGVDELMKSLSATIRNI